MKKVSSKIFLLNREDVAVFHSGIPFPGSQFVKIDVPSDVALIIVPVKMEFQEDKTTDHNCNQEAPDRKGTYCLTLNLLHNNRCILSDNIFLGCMEQYMQSHFKNFCQTPWLWSMVYRDQNVTDFKPCNDKDEYKKSNREFSEIFGLVHEEKCASK